MSYYHLGSIFRGSYATIAILFVLGILDQAMSGWIEKFILMVIIVPFVKLGAMTIGDFIEGVNLEV